MCISARLGIREQDILFLSKCAALHDVGRKITNDKEHGFFSGLILGSMFNNLEQQERAFWAVIYHDNEEKIYGRNDSNVLDAKIIHDADSLDYFRFGINRFSSKHLFLKESYEFIEMSAELNLFCFLYKKELLNYNINEFVDKLISI